MATWTKEQQHAIDQTGSDILVAAAAGSGKTAVLVERIIQKVINKESPMNIDEVFVSTFTNAAAEEMRTRIGQALEKAIREDPSSYHLKKQLSLLQRASISTLHSFCTNVIRQYSYMLDIDPGFRIGDDMEMALIRQEVLDDLLEDAYSREGEELESFYRTVDMFSSDRSDEKVGEIILKLYDFSKEYPWPEEWLKKQHEIYELDDSVDEEKLPWLTFLKEHVKEELQGYRERARKAIEIAREPDGPEQYLVTLEADLEIFNEGESKVDAWDDLQSFMNDFSWKSLSGKKSDCNEDKKNKAKKIRDKYKEDCNKLKDELFKRHLTGHLEDMRKLASAVKELTNLVIEFKDRFMKLKRERAIADFSDLEHFCLEILLDPTSTPDNMIPSTVAMQYKKQFKEVLIDEYQDINIVQEAILSVVSNEEIPGNRFMVGDVKQSIYRFRHAEPRLFIQKYHQFENDSDQGIKIDLAKNFRSREDVLSGTNYIFRQILDETLGEIEYDSKAELIYGNLGYEDFPLEDKKAELLLIDKTNQEEAVDDTGESIDDLVNQQIEARAYTEKIKEWLGLKDKPPLQVIDKETNKPRDIKYRDIVILKRNMTDSQVIMDEFKQQGIPIHAEVRSGYFAAIEIQVMINMLKTIDNPHQDIPIASVLKSPIVGLSEDELAQIRLAKKHVSYYTAMQIYLSDTDNPKVERFLTQLKEFRQFANEGALSELIWSIFTATGYYDFVGGIPGGRQRQANLRALYDRARGYESTSFRGLFRFLRFIERIDEEGKDLGEAPALSDQEDVVRMMTIHKSKGLEFPVVIIGGMSKQFQFVSGLSRESYILDKDYGFAMKYIDPEKRITYPTLFYTALKILSKYKQMAEEMRILYVAMTRAKEKLVMVGEVKEPEKEIGRWMDVLDLEGWTLPLHIRKKAKNFLDWLGPALIRHKSAENLRIDENEDAIWKEAYHDLSNWQFQLLSSEMLLNLEKEKGVTKEALRKTITEWDSTLIDNKGHDEEVNRILSFQYPFYKAAKTRAKESVTEIKRRQEVMDEASDEQFIKPFRAPLNNRPRFMQQDQTLTSAEIGTAMHAVMQHLPLKEPLNEETIRMWLEKFVLEEKLTTEEAEVIDVLAIQRFLESDIAKMIYESVYAEREVPFTYTLDATEIYPDWPRDTVDEKVLLQGVVDCLFQTSDGVYILDYKTDHISAEGMTEEISEALKKRYHTQIKLYRQAIEDILGEPVQAAYLYFFADDLLIKM